MASLLRCTALLLLLSAPALPAQTKTLAERLGYPADAKLLILHGDDLGVAHSVDAASFDALEQHAISSASVMMPTPWITEVAAWFKAHPDADIGLHLTVTAEWETYRWGSVASKGRVPTLLDSAGIFPNDVAPVARRAKPAEVELELRAQVERAIALGMKPTHLDSHMGALFATPELMAVYLRVARSYGLPVLAMRGDPHVPPHAALRANEVALDTVIIAGPEVAADKWKQFYLDAVAHLKPGLTEMIVHLGHDDAELQAVMVDHPDYGAAWRQRDFDVVTSAEFKQALAANGVVLVTWRDLARAVRQP